MLTKTTLDILQQKYEIREFITDDPIQFPHKFSSKKDIEIAGFLAALFAFGSRKIFIKKLEFLFKEMEYHPLEFILNGDINKL